ncbi:uncharacterized protein K452DRAFT_361349 [Aplosporella prunicola CBS 121167]|uniref:Uncharacterized protein n=1 Tax=Aplosporella prunicola CBS 121167 TaxID=1176127 RepID=A0A6A6B232_9PEZI|nr:uncharacterized protein K452DRAFT_361349 [Aplosporella prunicola CBS 121167]KAF2138272.1 hypothetical protein K452DRAFT_361349 [Aplosporella prunicola CBS 121167]
MEETVNRMEGEDESDSDLDITSAAHKDCVDLDSYIKDVTVEDTEGSETTDEDEQSQQAQLHQPAQVIADRATKVEWSDDDDAEAAYNAFKNRLSLKRKRAAASTRKAKVVAARKSTSMVGKRTRPKIVPNDGDIPTLKKHNTYGDDSEKEGQELLDNETLPDYIKVRMRKFEETRHKLGEAGLRIPPRFDEIYFSDDERLAHLQERPIFPELKPPGRYKDCILQTSAGIIPAPIAQWLREYQVEGAEFLHEKFVYQKGGILGDDMGLGKTIQVIAFLAAAFGKTGDERDKKRMRKMRRADKDYPRVLIVCPGSLMDNWKTELETWGWWQIYTFHGPPDNKEATLNAALKGRVEIVITTYTTYRINKSAINMVDWDCVIADECHIVKTRSSEITQAMNEINAICRLGLTGTAIQNNYEELWTLLNWTNPGKFGSLATWKQCISKPLKTGQAHDATYHELAKARRTANLLVKNLLPPFFLRRMKTLIANQLPKKSDRVVFCPLTDTQADAYENYINCDIVDCIRHSADICDCGSGKKRGWCHYAEIEGYGKWQNHVFPCIVTLQKLSNHLAQLIPSGVDTHDKQEKDLDDLKVAMPSEWRDLYRSRDNIINFANPEFCGKWKILKRLLQFWHQNGNKVLVFSHSVRLLKMLQMLFKSTSYNVSYLDGSMSYEERAQTVKDFNSDALQFVFLISVRAGGVGLNITSANKVVVVDPNWNPAYDLQAQDRAYRIGQTRDVEVFRLVSAGTIEEIVYARQIYKQQQANIGYNASSERRYFHGVQNQSEKKGEIFGLANLFSFQGDSVVLREIVNKTNIAESRAGVSVTGMDGLSQEVDEAGDFLGGEDEDAAMVQITTMIRSGSADDVSQDLKPAVKKTDAVQAILASAGVQYTHENSEVIGTSKVEARLSKRAAENENDIDFIGKHVFGPSGSQLSHALGEGRFRYKPPEDVQRRQFCTMAKTFGYEDVTEFALVVEGWTQEQRRNCLEKFYRLRRGEA